MIDRQRGKTVHGEQANAGHRVLAPDDAEVEAYLEVALDAPPPDRSPDDEPQTPDSVIVLDFGGQTAQLIARRVRELNVYSELLPFDTPWAEIERRPTRGDPVRRPDERLRGRRAASRSAHLVGRGMPVLGICYGVQLMAYHLGGDVVPASKREYGPATISITTEDGLFRGLDRLQPVWMSHGDSIVTPPQGFTPIAETASTPFAGLADPDRRMYGIQFHPGGGPHAGRSRHPAQLRAGHRRRAARPGRRPASSSRRSPRSASGSATAR